MPRGLVRGWTKHLVPPSPHFARTDPLDRGLVAEWRFDPVTGLMLPDYSGHGNRGSINPTANWINTRYGPALEATAANASFVTVPSSDELSLTEFTLEIFMAWSELATAYVYAKDNGAGTENYYMYWHLGTTKYVFGFRGSLGWRDHEYVKTPTLGDFYHIAITYDLARIKFYEDSVAVTDDAETDTPVTGAGILFMGSSAVSTLRVGGDIAIFRIYNRALTAAEVQARYQKCLKRGQAMASVWMIPWGMVTAIPRIPRIPAAYNTLMIY